MSEQKTLGEERREALFLEKKNGYDLVDEAALAGMEEYGEGYKRFLDQAKTEREAVEAAVALAEEQALSALSGA